MAGTIKLVFIRPVDDRIPIIPDGGEYGASRPYGSHTGLISRLAWKECMRSKADGSYTPTTERGRKIKPTTGMSSSSIMPLRQVKTSAIYIPSMPILTVY